MTSSTHLARTQRRPGAGLQALCALSALMALGSAHANLNGGGTDVFNEYHVPNGTPISFEWDFSGDWTSYIPTQADDDDSINPFVWASIALGHAVNPTSITYDQATDTTRVVQSGDALPSTVPAGYVNWYIDPYSNQPTYHVGFNLSSPQNYLVPYLNSAHWNYPAADPFEFGPFVVVWGGTFTKKSKKVAWLVVFIENLDPMTKKFSSGRWEIKPYDPANPKTFSIANPGREPLVLKSIGILPNVPPPTDPDCLENPQCEANKQMLDSLQSRDFPPPGQPGSPFTPVKVPKAPIPPGGSFTFKIH